MRLLALVLMIMNDYIVICLQESTVDIWLMLVNRRLQLRLHVTSGNVTLTSDPLSVTSDDLVNTDDDDTRCSFHVDVNFQRNHVAVTGVFSIHCHATLLLSPLPLTKTGIVANVYDYVSVQTNQNAAAVLLCGVTTYSK